MSSVTKIMVDTFNFDFGLAILNTIAKDPEHITVDDQREASSIIEGMGIIALDKSLSQEGVYHITLGRPEIFIGHKGSIIKKVESILGVKFRVIESTLERDILSIISHLP